MQPHDIPEVPQKQCYLCKKFHPATTDYFQGDRSKKDGFASRCKSCQGKPKPIKYAKLTCSECGKEFTRKISQLSGDKEYYCSLQCAGLGYKRLYSGENSVHYNSIDTECAQCGKRFSRKASKIEKTQNHFCSYSCMGQWRAANLAGENSPHYNRIKTNCRQCGSELKVMPKDFNEHGNFCDHRCYGDWRSTNIVGEGNPLYAQVEIECRQCSNLFTVPPSRILKGGNFCSKRCANNFQRTGRNPLAIKMAGQRRRSRRAKFPADYTADDWQFALNYFNGCCAVCDRPILGLFHTAHMDHWFALATPDCPGTVPGNIVPLCGGKDGCNTSKNARDPEEWLIKKFGKRKAKAILARIHEFFSKVRQV